MHGFSNFGSCVALTLAAASASAQDGWRMTRLPDLPSGTNAYNAAAINNAGQIVGWSWTGSDARAVQWQDGRISDLGSLRTTPFGFNAASDVNDAGQVVGATDTPEHVYRGALWQGGRISALAPLPGWQESAANAINASGTIVGGSGTGSGGVPTLWQNGQAIALSVPISFQSGVAVDINTSGQIVLRGDYGSSFVGRSGSFTDLGHFSAEIPITQAHSINDAGQVVGASFTDGAMHAFLWEGGHMRDLGVPAGFTWSEAIAINASGQVVGFAERRAPITGDATTHAILWDGERVVDLTSQLGGGDEGWQLRPSDINDAGTIVGTGYDEHGHTIAFALAPVPEPATVSLLLAGGLLAGGMRRSVVQRCSRRYAL